MTTRTVDEAADTTISVIDVGETLSQRMVERALAHAEEIWSSTYPQPDFRTREDQDIYVLAREVLRLRGELGDATHCDACGALQMIAEQSA